MVSANAAYRNALENADHENARVEHDKALETVLIYMLRCSDELYKMFMENTTFSHWLRSKSFDQTYKNQEPEITVSSPAITYGLRRLRILRC